MTVTANEDSEKRVHTLPWRNIWTPCTAHITIVLTQPNGMKWSQTDKKYREEVVLLQKHSGNSKSNREKN